jgi:peptidyl-prolyl cis-trans isomerase SurA
MLLAVSAPSSVKAKSKDKLVDKIAAVVGTQIILFSEVLEQAAPALQEIEKMSQGAQGVSGLLGGRKDTAIKETLNRMIDDEIFLIEAREMELAVTQEELDVAVANVARENNLDVPALKNAIKEQGMDFLTYRNQLRRQLTRFKVLNLRVRSRIKITDAEARQHYNDQVRDIRATGTYEGAHILVRATGDQPAAEVAKAKRRAEAILERLEKGEAFAEVARKESEDSATAPHGGSLGMRTPGTIPAVLEKAFFDLEPGEVAGPIRTPAGFHLIKLNAREALGVMPFKEVKDKIVMALQEEEMERQAAIWIKEQRARIFIDVRM